MGQATRSLSPFGGRDAVQRAFPVAVPFACLSGSASVTVVTRGAGGDSEARGPNNSDIYPFAPTDPPKASLTADQTRRMTCSRYSLRSSGLWSVRGRAGGAPETGS